MRRIINFLKEYIPKNIWTFVRSVYFKVYDFIKGIGPYVRKTEYCGYTLFYNKGNSIIQRIKKEGVFEREMCEKMLNNIVNKDRPNILDIGANIGLISLYLISKKPKANIFAFEPGNVQRDMLKKTIAENNISNFKIYSEAISKENGEALFCQHNISRVANDGLIDTGRAGKSCKSLVKTITLDKWWEDNNKPNIDLIKIDTEGAELWVLQGANKLLAKRKPTIFLEIEPMNLKVYPYNQLDILSFFQNCDYNLFTLNDIKVDKDNLGELLTIEDTFVATPKSY